MKKAITLLMTGFIILVVFGFSVNAAAQKQQVRALYGQLEGIVKDGDDNPIEGALVRIFGGYIDFEDFKYAIIYEKEYTDTNGFYSFNIPEGKYIILVTMNGYLPGFRFTVVSQGETEVANFNLISLKLHNVPL